MGARTPTQEGTLPKQERERSQLGKGDMGPAEETIEWFWILDVDRLLTVAEAFPESFVVSLWAAGEEIIDIHCE